MLNNSGILVLIPCAVFVMRHLGKVGFVGFVGFVLCASSCTAWDALAAHGAAAQLPWLSSVLLFLKLCGDVCSLYQCRKRGLRLFISDRLISLSK